MAGIWDEEYRLFGEPPVEIGDVIDIGGKNVEITDVEPMIYEHRNRNQFGVDIGFNTGTYPINELKPPSNTAYLIGFVGIRAAGVQSIGIRFRYPSEVNLFTISARQTVIDVTVSNYMNPIRMPMLIRDMQSLIAIVEAPAPNMLDGIWFYGYQVRFNNTESNRPITKRLPHRRVNSYK